MAKLEPVDGNPAPRRKATTSSFRIPLIWQQRAREEAARLDMSLSQFYNMCITQYFDAGRADSWDTVNDPEHYDPMRFYTHAEDKKGHSFHVRTNIPKPLAGEMAALIQSGEIPSYRAMGDIARDAIYHRVKTLARMLEAGELEQQADMAMMLSDELQMVDEAQTADHLIEAIRTNTAVMVRKGDTKRLKKYLAQRRDRADQVPEAYRPDYLAAIEEGERHLGKVQKKTSRRRR